MSHRWKLVGIYAAVTAVALVILYVATHSIQPAIAKGTPNDVTTAGWITLVTGIIGSLSAGGMTLGNFILAIHDMLTNWVKNKTQNSSSATVRELGQDLIAVVDASQDRFFVKLYNNEKDPSLKLEIKELWKKSKMAQLDRDVPDPVIIPPSPPAIPSADATTIAQMISQLGAIQSAGIGTSTLK